MSRPDARAAVVRFGLTAVLVLGTAFGWVAALTFDPADPPSPSVFPPNAQIQNWCGQLGANLAYHAFYRVGWAGTLTFLTLCTFAVIALCRNARPGVLWVRFCGVAIICAAISTAATTLSLRGTLLPASDKYVLTGPGGVLGLSGAHVLQPLTGWAGSWIVIACALVAGLVLAADELLVGAAHVVQRMLGAGGVLTSAGAALRGAVTTVAGGLSASGDTVAVATPPPAGNGRAKPPRRLTRAEQLALDLPDEPAPDRGGDSYADEEPPAEPPAAEPPVEDPAAAAAAASSAATARFRALRPAAPPEPSAVAAALYRPPDAAGYELPSLQLLEEASAVDRTQIEELCRQKAMTLEQTLNEFRLEVEVVAIETGPVITVFELRLAPGIKVSQIASLTNDMARALGAPAVRVVAPLPGKNTIGIEVPNIDKERVRLKDVIRSVAPRLSKYEIPLFLGKDAAGQPLVTDLTRMPHLLIAGTTGSGKSVCVASIVMSLLLTRTPSEVQAILIDPKVVELTAFKDIPHLMCPIVSEMSKAEGILEWASTKMDERYALFAEAGVKDIRGYNRLGAEVLRERFQPTCEDEMLRIPLKLPYIIIIIDELADLMMTSAKEVEFHLCRIAQKSRAVGIHLIVSTQRPSANVVTGLIKSNLPSRIAFRVASRLDSRIVLDQNGGEVLMGQGDMLFLPPGSSKLIRAQGTFVGDDELKAVVKFASSQCTQSFHPELMRAPNAGADAGGERDELFDQAVELIVASGRGSVSLLQRRLTIGYSRASRLVEQMYAAGIVGEYKGSQAREVVLTKEEWEALRNQRNREEADEAAAS